MEGLFSYLREPGHFLLHQLISPLCPRGACLWRPWLSSTNHLPRQVRKHVDLVSWSLYPTCSCTHKTTCRHADLVPSQRGPQPVSFDSGCRPGKALSQPCPLLIPTTALGGRQGALWGNLAVQKAEPQSMRGTWAGSTVHVQWGWC